jgi:hypothetical protein
METQDLIRILKEVPETRLRIIDLAWKVVDDDGVIDPDKVALYAAEIEEAKNEAQSYSKATAGVVQCLKSLAR